MGKQKQNISNRPRLLYKDITMIKIKPSNLPQEDWVDRARHPRRDEFYKWLKESEDNVVGRAGMDNSCPWHEYIDAPSNWICLVNDDDTIIEENAIGEGYTGKESIDHPKWLLQFIKRLDAQHDIGDKVTGKHCASILKSILC